MAVKNQYLFAAALTSTALTDDYKVVASTASRDTTTMTNPSVKFAMTSGNQDAYVDPGHNAYPYANVRKTVIKARIRISGTPAGNYILYDFFRNGTSGIWIDVNRKFNVGVSATHLTTSTNTITANTEYIFEGLFDLDVGSLGTFKAKLSDSSGTLIEEITYTLVSGDSTPTYNPYVGMINIKGASNPAINVWFGEVVQTWEDGSDTISYIGISAYPQTAAAPSAVSSYNDFTASTGSDKVATVDELPSNGDTDYDHQQMVGAPSTILTLADSGVAGNLNGTYKYSFTNVTADGESSDGGQFATITVTNRQVDISAIATGPTGTTARKLYRTVASGNQRKLLTTINDNTTTTYRDNILDANLGANVPVDGTGTASPKQQDFIFSGSGLTSPTDYALSLGNTSAWSTYLSSNFGWSSQPSDNSTVDLTKISFGIKLVTLTGGLDLSYDFKVTTINVVKVTANSDGTGTVKGYCFFAVLKAVSSATAPISLLTRFSGTVVAGGPTIFLNPNSFMGPL